MREPLPLARVHDAILNFLRNRDDAVLFGAQAVNAYVDEARMTQGVDILSTRARELAEELREHLAKTFTIATRVREAHLAHVRQIDTLPPTRIVFEVRVPTPEELIAHKAISFSLRSAQPKGGTDSRDLKALLLAYPQLKTATGPVLKRLHAAGADERALAEWNRLVATEIESPGDADEFE